MAAPRAHLAKAPAREALIDIQFEPTVLPEHVEAFARSAAPSFERTTNLFEAFVGFNADGSPASTGQSLVGWRLDSDKSHYVLQARVGGFTLSRLSPYGEWGELRGEASKWWGMFCEVAKPQVITRIAVRYVNAIKLPLPITDFRDFLTCSPRMPDELPQAVSGFLQRVVAPDDVNNCTTIVTQALEGPPAPEGEGGSITVLLDIDVFRATRIPASEPQDVWAGLDQLRNAKNRMFFAHLTDRAVEMFQ